MNESNKILLCYCKSYFVMYIHFNINLDVQYATNISNL